MRNHIIACLQQQLSNLSSEDISKMLEVPSNDTLGDYAFPCFTLAKQLKKAPPLIASDLATTIVPSGPIVRIVAQGPYVNFFVDRNQRAQQIITNITTQSVYGSTVAGQGKTIVIEMSSPNIAKPFGVGHLRSTIIGNAIAKLYEYQGYTVVRINYLGDWGTQFGKLLVAYRKYGNPQELQANAIKHLLSLYVRINAEMNEALEEEARQTFKALEEGDAESLALWTQFRELSLREFDTIYNMLGVSFDVISGESKYNHKAKDVLEQLNSKGLVTESDGALVVDLEAENLGVAIVQKKDGTTIYAGRDIAAAIDRKEQYGFEKMIYEVGAEQQLHFQQVFTILEKMGYSWAKDCHHVSHGLYLDADGKKFSTRKGKVVLMEEVLEQTIQIARDELKKRYDLAEDELYARALTIARAAIIFGDLKNFRMLNIVFDIDKFTSFEGDTGPYVLYSYARANSILAKVEPGASYNIITVTDEEMRLLKKIEEFPAVTQKACQDHNPAHVANYILQLSRQFTDFYHNSKVIGDENQDFRIQIVICFTTVMRQALLLLGIKPIERM